MDSIGNAKVRVWLFLVFAALVCSSSSLAAPPALPLPQGAPANEPSAVSEEILPPLEVSSGTQGSTPSALPLTLPVPQVELPTPSPPAPAFDAPRPSPTHLPPGANELAVEDVVAQVLARNPSLAQMQAAHEAASARYPQVTSLDDPMIGFTGAPTAIGDTALLNRGYRFEVAQKYPFPGKLKLRGESAQAEARAAGNEVDDMRLQLVESARSAFYDYYLVGRALAVNEENRRLLRGFKQNAETRYCTGLAPQQDVLQAEVEIARQQERQAELEQQLRIALARINTLMHLPPDAPPPPPPERVSLAEALPEPGALRQAAVAHRPDLQALANRVQAEEAALGLAHKEFYPDFEVGGAYDTFWAERPQQWQLSVKMNLPMRQARPQAAVAEALAKTAQRRAELARQTDQVNFQVQEAYCLRSQNLQ